MKPTEVLKQLYVAFAGGDGATLESLLGDTDWVEAKGGPYGGRYRGLAEVAANVFGPIARDVSDFSAVPDEVVDVGNDRALAVGFYRGVTSVGPLEIRFAHLITVNAGQITQFEQFTDTREWHQAVAD